MLKGLYNKMFRRFTSAVDMSPVVAKAGFTLAEVLITLGIIGVVAAMTIPNLIGNIKDKRSYTLLKSTQSILANAIRLAEEEYGDMSGWDVKMATGEGTEQDAKAIAKVLKEFLKLSLDCGTYDEKGYCIPAAKYLLLNGTPYNEYFKIRNYYKINLLNGTSVWWRAASKDEYKNYNRVAVFFVDLNGTKLPNQVGRDLFTFAYEKGSLRAIGAPGYHESDTCKLSSTGWGCAYFLLQHGHMKYPN